LSSLLLCMFACFAVTLAGGVKPFRILGISEFRDTTSISLYPGPSSAAAAPQALIKLSDNTDGLTTFSSALGFASTVYIPATTLDSNLNSHAWIYEVNLVTKKIIRVSTGNYTWPNNIIYDAKDNSLFFVGAIEDGTDSATIFSLKPGTLAMTPVATYSDPGNLGIVAYSPTNKTFAAACNGPKNSSLLTLGTSGQLTRVLSKGTRIEGLFYDHKKDTILAVLSSPRNGGGTLYSLWRLYNNGIFLKAFDLNMTSYGTQATLYPVVLNTNARSLLFYVSPKGDSAYYLNLHNVDAVAPAKTYFVPQPATSKPSFFTFAASFIFA